MKSSASRQLGASLLEVLVAILILSFGMLALSGMLAYAVQMPKLAAYRATATVLAANQVERMRANRAGFALDSYKETMTYNAALPVVVRCVYPACTPDSLATRDKDEANQTVFRQLPQGGMRVTCNGPCSDLNGDLWVIWQEPSTFAALNAANSDECPDPATAPTFTAFVDPKPRCLHVKFKL